MAPEENRGELEGTFHHFFISLMQQFRSGLRLAHERLLKVRLELILGFGPLINGDKCIVRVLGQNEVHFLHLKFVAVDFGESTLELLKEIEAKRGVTETSTLPLFPSFWVRQPSAKP